MSSFANSTPLRLGMETAVGGKRFRIVARLVMGVVEEGQNYYWDEFLLQADDGEFFFVELDEGQWRRIKPFEPQRKYTMAEAVQFRVGQQLRLGREASPVISKVDTATLHHVEGRPNWAARVGERVRYVDAHAGSALYVLEWEPDGTITAYRGIPMSRRQVYEMFGLTEQIAALDRANKAAGARALFGGTCLGMALLAFIVTLAANSPTAGRSVSRGSGTIAAPPAATRPSSPGWPYGMDPVTSTATQTGDVRFGPVRLEPGQNVHRLVVYTNTLSPDATVTAELRPVDSPTTASTTAAAAPGGPVTSFTQNAGDDFRIGRAGEYEVVVSGPASHAVGYDVRGGVWYTWWLSAYAVAACAVGVAFLLFAWAGKAASAA